MKTKSGKEISKVGIGSFGIGGRGHRDVDLTDKLADNVYIDALIYTLNRGFNFTEIALGYGHGQSLGLFKQALDKSSVERDDIFLTHSLYPKDLPDLETIKQDLNSFYCVMETAYADSTLVTQSLIKKFGSQEIYSLLHQLLTEGKTRFVSLSNATPEGIREFKKEFDDTFFAHEGHLSFEVRVLQDQGVFKTCDELGVRNIIWRPLRKGKTAEHNWPLLNELAEKYQKTQNQIVLNWMCNLGYYPMVMSTDTSHIDENATATDFKMVENDYQRMTEFRPKITLDPSLKGDDLVTLINDFEKLESKATRE